MSERPTPETDAELNDNHGGTNGPWASPEFARRIERERDELREWKESQIKVDAELDVQAVAKMLGGKLGQSCRKVISEQVQKLIDDRRLAVLLLREIIASLPTRRDWLSPDWEKATKEFLKTQSK